MDKYIINGGNKLYGEVNIQTAKNAVLPILAASILSDGKVMIKNVPEICDVYNMVKILNCLGCKVVYMGKDILIDPTFADCFEIPCNLASELRSSIFLLGSVVSRFKKAKIAYPGGCDIGLRPIDLHLEGLKRLGVQIEQKEGFINCTCKKLVGCEIVLDCQSVGATENIMLAAVKAEGRTVIKNAAMEPEIEDLQNFLNAMGADVKGAGSGTIIINGVKKLGGVTYTPICDRIEAGTFLIAAATCGGDVTLNMPNGQILACLLHKLRQNGCKIYIKNDKINIRSNGRMMAVKNTRTQPYPGFPTDLQAQYCALCCTAAGNSMIEENVFEMRFKYVSELKKMGADISVVERVAFICGVEKLHGATLVAADLRGGAALVIAALAAFGQSQVLNIGHIDRGYSNFEYKLKKIGADIVRVVV
jgi:UDP-N-acetylglucosamine 1-carboxyvinyltransferase